MNNRMQQRQFIAPSASESVFAPAGRLSRWRSGLMLVLALAGVVRADDALDSAALAAKSKANAEATKFVRLDGAKSLPLNLSPKPLLSYADNPRGIHDARLWLLQVDQRPAALMKTEYMTLNGWPQWVYCVSSWSKPNIQVTLPLGKQWTSSKPGVEWQSLPTDFSTSETAAGRLRQLKETARRFSATSIDEVAPAGAQEMRLLNQPLVRYSAPGEGILDAALFGLTNNGTNPDLILALEIVGNTGGPLEWRYAAAQMTSARLHMRLDDKEVWAAPYVRVVTGSLHDQERWMFVAEFPESQGRK
jgi:hypothetical protein